MSEVGRMLQRARILFVLSSLRDLASVRYPMELAGELQRRGHHVEIFYFDPIQDLQPRVPSRRVSFFSRRDLSGYDIVHTHGFRPDLFGFLHARRGPWLVSTLHSYIWDDLKSLYSAWIAIPALFIWKKILKYFDLVTVLNHHACEAYREYLPGSTIQSVHSGLPDFDAQPADQEFVRQIEVLKAGGYVVLGTAARLVSLKGLDQVIHLLARRKDLFFVIIGSGQEEAPLRDLARRLGVESRILFTGHIPRAERCFPFFDICIIPSRSEGFCFTLLEAIQVKVPVVCSAIPVFEELYSADEVCFFELDNLDSLSDAIDRAMGTRDQLVENAYTRYLNDYTLSAMVDRYESVYGALSEQNQVVGERARTEA